MAASVVFLSRESYHLVTRPAPASLAWLALALALAIIGLTVGQAAILAGATIAGASLLALLPTCGGLGIALGMLIQEVTPCARQPYSF